MTTRRKVLAGLGVGALMPKALLAQPRNERRRRSWLEMLRDQPKTAPVAVHPNPGSWKNDTITAAWIGHATVLMNFYGTWILTDPVFSEQIGISVLGLLTIGPRRLVAPALTIDELPRLDLILLSHAHMDHMDLPSLRQLNKSTPVVMAKNTADILNGRGWKEVRELDWNESMMLNGLTIEALKVRHFGWRYPWEEDRSRGNVGGRSFNAYLLTKNGKHILFGGDTAYQEYFKELASRNISIELAMMPIGAYDPWIYVHCNPEQAAAMAGHMNARSILPLHWNTFTLSNEPQQEPIERLKKALAGTSMKLALEQQGETWRLEAPVA